MSAFEEERRELDACSSHRLGIKLFLLLLAANEEHRDDHHDDHREDHQADHQEGHQDGDQDEDEGKEDIQLWAVDWRWPLEFAVSLPHCWPEGTTGVAQLATILDTPPDRTLL